MIDSRYEGDDIIVDNIGDVYHPKVGRMHVLYEPHTFECNNVTHNVGLHRSFSVQLLRFVNHASSKMGPAR